MRYVLRLVEKQGMSRAGKEMKSKAKIYKTQGQVYGKNKTNQLRLPGKQEWKYERDVLESREGSVSKKKEYQLYVKWYWLNKMWAENWLCPIVATC